MKTYLSINAEVVKALQPIIPVAHLEYPDGGREYATFDITVTRGVNHASGMNHGVLCYGYLDVFTDYDPTGSCSILEEIDRALDQAGFSVQSISGTRYFREMHKYHTQISYQALVDIGGEENGG